MAKKIINAQMKQRRDTKANWAANNPVLLAGELGIVSDDPNLYKVGDGTTAWNALPFRGFDGTLVHTTGDSETAAMSQKGVTEELAKLSEEVEKKCDAVVVSNNLFNKNAVDYPNAILGGNTVGNKQTVEYREQLSVFKVKVQGGEAYTFGGNGDVRTYSFTDDNGIVVLGNTWVNEATTQYVTAPDNATYLWLSVYINAIDKAQVNKGATKLPYDEYKVGISYNGADLLADLRQEIGDFADDVYLSDYAVFNQLVAEIYAPCISSESIKYLRLLRVAHPLNGKFYNFIGLGESDNSNTLLLDESYATKEEALNAWQGIHWYQGNAFLLKGSPNDSYDLPATVSISFFKNFNEDAASIIAQKTIAEQSKIEGLIDQLSEEVKGLFPSVNLFTGEYDEGFWTLAGLNPTSGYFVTKPILIKGGVAYKYPLNSASYGSNFTNYALYDILGNYVTVKKATEQDGYVILTEDEDCYVSVNIGDSVTMRESFVFAEESQYPSSYIPYQPTLKKGLYIPESAIVSPSPLNGKIIAVNGDSICAGAGYAGGYGKIISERNKMVLQNIGVGGGTITSGVVASDGTLRHSICDTVVNMREDADYILLEGGVNDAGLSLPVGKISEGYNATLDTSTYCGAFEYMLKMLVSRFAGKKYGYIAVHQCVAKYRVTDTDKTTSYYWLSKAMCEKWGVPFCDLNSTVPPFNYLSNSLISEVNATYTNNGDGWHPNEEGYKKYYCDKIEAFMLSL